MYCSKCGRGIRDDSVYCSYCGVKLEEEAEETEREAGPSHEPACVVPGAPKKRCQDCGKELPGSAISDLCAMCSIRRRNREIDAERERSEASAASRDRYDISDQFDQSVFSQSSYYSGSDEPDYRKAGRGASSGEASGTASGSPRAKPGKRSGGGCLKAVLIVLGILLLLGVLVGVLSCSTLSPEPIVREVSSAEEVALVENALPSLTREPDSEPETRTLDTRDREELFYAFIVPIAEQELYYGSGLADEDGFVFGEFVHDPASLTSEDAYFQISGLMRYTLDDVFFEDPYIFRVLLSPESYSIVSLLLGGQYLYDFSGETLPDGTLTELGAAYYDSAEGACIFGEGVLRLDEFS